MIFQISQTYSQSKSKDGSIVEIERHPAKQSTNVPKGNNRNKKEDYAEKKRPKIMQIFSRKKRTRKQKKNLLTFFKINIGTFIINR